MIIAIDPVGNGSFKINNINQVENHSERLNHFLKKPENFILSFRASDNSYHEVNSSICEKIRKNKDLIEKGISLPSLAASITGIRDLKVKRYVIWKNGREAYLVGEILHALKEISEATNE